jgi:hypothetical protein
MAAAAKRVWLGSSRPVSARAPGTIVAKGVSRAVQAIVELGDRIVVTHHEGLMSSPGGVTVRRRDDFSVVAAMTGASGRIETSGDYWIASGPSWIGRDASARFIDPTSLAVVDTFPFCAPFARRDARRVLAHTPPRAAGTVDGAFGELDAYAVDPAEVAAAGVALPHQQGLVELDLEHRRSQLVAESRPFDPFRHCVLSPDRQVAYAATSFGRVVAIRLDDRRSLWEVPPVATVMELSVYAMARDATGAWLAIAGAGRDADLRILDASTGRVVRELAICRLVGRARVTAKRSARIEALAYHRSGWLALATSGGVIVELQPGDEPPSAFRAASAGIDAIAFLDEGRALLVGGREPQLRLWPVDC